MMYTRISIIVLLFIATLISCDNDVYRASDIAVLVTAQFDASAEGIFAGESVKFSDESLGEPTSREWVFDGGTPSTSNEQNPTVTYNEAGRFNVTLKVSNEDGEDIMTKEGFILVQEETSSDVLASYPFDGSAEDTTANEFHPENIGDVTFDGTDRHGNVNSAAVFSGNNVLYIPSDPVFDESLSTNDFSVSVWVKTESTDHMMIWQEGGIGGIDGSKQAWFRIGKNTTDRLMRFSVGDDTGQYNLDYGEGPDSGVSDGSWHHVVCVREGTTLRIYRDGQLVAVGDADVAKDVAWIDRGFKIGAQEGKSEKGFKKNFVGSLDDLIIFEKALSEEAIMELYNQ